VLALSVALTLSAAPPTQEGADFIDDVRPLFRLVTCQGDLPASLDAKTAETWCVTQKARYEKFHDGWGPRAHDFVTVITTLSLELAGDPRHWKNIKDAKMLKTSLGLISNASASTLMSNDSLSKNLSATQRGELPGQLSMHLMGLALADQEPVSVRFFSVQEDGTLHYLTAEEIAAVEGTTASKLKSTWRAPDFSPAFANVEVQFVPKGKLDAPRRVHRHIAANLGDKDVPAGLLKHLSNKGRITAMTKAASYLLWRDDFAKMREWLTSSAVFMVSDSTGVPPRHWLAKGCTVEAYGQFQKSFLGTWEGYQEELRKTFAGAKSVPMRFGYPDGSEHKFNHLLTATCVAKK
jgi:hypothetical protein